MCSSDLELEDLLIGRIELAGRVDAEEIEEQCHRLRPPGLARNVREASRNVLFEQRQRGQQTTAHHAGEQARALQRGCDAQDTVDLLRISAMFVENLQPAPKRDRGEPAASPSIVGIKLVPVA